MKSMLKHMGIRTRLSLVYTIVTTVVILTVILFIYNTYMKQVEWESENNFRQIAKAVMDRVDNHLDAIDQVTIDAMIARDFRNCWEKWNSPEHSAEDETALRRILIDTYRTRSNIRRVSVYNLDGDYVCTNSSERTREEVRKRGLEMLEKYNMNEVTSRVYLGSAVDFWNPYRGIQVITEVKPIKNHKTEITGFIEVQQNIRYLDEVCRMKMNGQEVAVTILLNDPEEVLFSTMEKGSALDIEGIEQFTNQYSRIHTIGSNVVFITPSNTYYCDTVAVVPRKVFLASASNMIRGILLFGLLMILVNIIFCQIMTRLILQPFTELVRFMEKTDLTTFGEKPAFKTSIPETAIVVRSFENMTERLHQSLEKQKKMEDIQTQAVFDALQSTIGPHFLYNSLGGIANMCEEGENEAAADACYSLTEILRYASGYVDAEVTFHDEIDNIRSYLSIMKSRYRQRLEYAIHMDEECAYQMLPKLTLQPLVENAIKYSLLEQETVIVRVDVRCQGKKVSVEVADNGCGISAEEERRIGEELEAFRKDRTKLYEPERIRFGGMGLAGTLIRLSLFYEDRFWYRIDSENKEGGTSIWFGFTI